jgi:hypothetical protein
MQRQTTTKNKPESITSPPLSRGILHRKCGGDNQFAGGGECVECGKKNQFLQRRAIHLSESGDRYEQEADRIANQVMRVQEPTAKHQVGSEKEGVLQRKAIADSITPLQSISMGQDQVSEVPPLVNEALQSRGQPLDAETRAFMEPRFGYDFSQVRVHTDSPTARAINASAYAFGKDIIFASSTYAPKTSNGKKLLAHELSHVVQQAQVDRVGQSVNPETQAHHAAERVVRGESISHTDIGGSAIGVYADNGKDPSLDSSGTYQPRFPSIVPPFQVDSSFINELSKLGLLSPQMQQLIVSGQIEIKKEDRPQPAAPKNEPNADSTKSFASELNSFSLKLPGIGMGSIGFYDSGLQMVPIPAPQPQNITVGGYVDPVFGYVPRHQVIWTPEPPASKSSEPSNTFEQAINKIKQFVSGLQTKFDFSDGLSVYHQNLPNLVTSVWVTGIVLKSSPVNGVTPKITGGFDKSLELQLSYKNWYISGSVDTDGKWQFKLSYPNDSSLSPLPWVESIFSEGGVAMGGLVDIVREGPPDLNNFDAYKDRITPHINRMKNAIDVAKGIASSQPGWNASVVIGNGPRPGAPQPAPNTPPTGIYIGGSLALSF